MSFSDTIEAVSDEQLEEDFRLVHLGYRMDGGEDVLNEYQECVERTREAYSTMRHAFEEALGL